MMMGFLNAVGAVTGNDDTVAIRIGTASSSTTINYTGDGGNYNLRFKLV